MTFFHATLGLVVGALMVVGAVVWLFGPWGLLGFGMVVIALSLLAPTRDALPPPTEPPPPA